MGKLSSLKTWYSLSDAVEHLAGALDEPVEEQALLQLVVDGHISLYCRLESSPARRVAQACLFEHHIDGLPEHCRPEQVRWIGAEALLPSVDSDQSNSYSLFAKLRWADCDKAPVVEELSGVFQLEFSMDSQMRTWLGSLADGKYVPADYLRGLWISDQLGQTWSVLELVPEQYFYHPDHGATFRDSYYRPTPRTPSQSQLAFSKTEIRALVKRLSTDESAPRPEINSKERQTLLNLIGGLLELMLGESPGGNPLSAYRSQAAVIDALLASHEGKPGITKRTMEEKFAQAKRQLNSY